MGCRNQDTVLCVGLRNEDTVRGGEESRIGAQDSHTFPKWPCEDRCRVNVAFVRQPRPVHGLYRVNVAHTRQLRPVSGRSFQMKVLKIFSIALSSLGSGLRMWFERQRLQSSIPI